MALAVAFIAVFPLEASSGSPSEIVLTLSQDTLNFDDGLDARDAQGRPIAAPQARVELRTLFVGGLFQLLMRPDLPRVAETLAALRRVWRLAAENLQRALVDFGPVVAALAASIGKRFLALFLALMGTLLFLAHSRRPAPAYSRRARFHEMLSSVVLRR